MASVLRAVWVFQPLKSQNKVIVNSGSHPQSAGAAELQRLKYQLDKVLCPSHPNYQIESID